jgi:Ran GTPase-activating protein (RanGAP) involved in mRNA processing and transport
MGDGPGFAQELAAGIKDSGAMTTLILKDNRLLNNESGTALGNMLKFNTVLTKLDVSDNGYDSDEDDGPGFAQGLAIGIKDNEALSVLSLRKNRLGTKEVGKVLREMLKVNSVLKGLDLSENVAYPGDPAGFAQELAVGIKDNGALSVLSLKSNELCANGGKALAEGLKGNTVMTELDISSNYLGEDSSENPDMSGVVALAGAIPDMGALTTLDISRNPMPSKQKEGLQRICAAGGIELAI